MKLHKFGLKADLPATHRSGPGTVPSNSTHRNGPEENALAQKMAQRPKTAQGQNGQLGQWPKSAQWANGQQWYGFSTKLYIE